MLQQPIAATAPASGSDRRRWAAIFVAFPPRRYRIVDTEFDVVLLNKYAKYRDEDSAIENQKEYYVAHVNELYALLTNLEVDPESFNAPWHVEHPLL